MTRITNNHYNFLITTDFKSEWSKSKENKIEVVTYK